MPIVLVISGFAVAMGVPFVWASPIPVWIGAALVLVGAAWTRKPWIAALGFVAAVALILAPGVINGYRNGQGIAWTVPEGERVRLAQNGLLVTAPIGEPVLRGRDLRTGERTWELRLPGGDGNAGLWRVGPLVLTTGFDETLRAIDVAAGKVRWESPGDVVFAAVTDEEHLAVTRCPTLETCEVQSLSLADGTVAWRAPVRDEARSLGVPRPEGASAQQGIVPWPASFVLTGDERRYEARDLATGRVLASGDRDRRLTLLGDVLVRSSEDGALTAANVQTGERLWSRPAGDGRASLSTDVSQGALALPEGKLVLSGDGFAIDSVRLGDALRTVDVQTGEVDEEPIDVDSSLVEVLASDRPSDRLPVVFWRDYEGDAVRSRIIADGRTYDRDTTRDVDVAPGLLGFGSDGRTWGTDLERVYEVFDRDSGERVVRYAGEDFDVSAVGDVLVITEGEDDDATQRVVAP